MSERVARSIVLKSGSINRFEGQLMWTPKSNPPSKFFLYAAAAAAAAATVVAAPTAAAAEKIFVLKIFRLIFFLGKQIFRPEFFFAWYIIKFAWNIF